MQLKKPLVVVGNARVLKLPIKILCRNCIYWPVGYTCKYWVMLYRYTQELRRPDLLDAKGKPLIQNTRLKAVWSRLANRMATVVADTSMVTISPQYATHFYDMYINGKDNAKLTGDRMKILMLSLPFMIRDLVAPEVSWDNLTYSMI